MVRVGRIVGAHGLRGELKVEPLTRFLERFEPGRTLCLQGQSYKVESCRGHGDRLLVKLVEIDGRSAAESLQWSFLESADAERPGLDEDEYLSRDLLGMAVRTEEGEDLGVVGSVLEYPAHDVLVVGEMMIPAVKEFVREVDLEARRMVVRLIEGMREPSST